jgi:muconolactone delta-isomerase
MMAQFMVVSTFFEGVDMREVLQVVEEEKAKVKELQEQGRLGEIRLAVPQGKVFLDVFANDEDEAITIVKELPMARWWNLDAYTLSGTA